ncbi:NB-ARC domain-containing protein [Lyngbya sp. CCY1209]|uniref:NB-ARC domain-containing protein n=1 Tax=Lyngbya sp. CCY1209 TaxID=2886103 RepID=UPI002D218147|nr:NB-ARC domain-containing protein [Lyngbya sp. CCY1209]MEB3884342.1 NACHT domain-containing protein [Lyngbya sp. CCY1209]
MEMQEALQWTDHLIFDRTGKHLDSLQRAILEGAWEGKGYKTIAEEYHCTNDHVRKSASELWKLLSDLLGEDVRKKNVRSLLENGVFSYYNDGLLIGNQINLCNDPYNHWEKPEKRSPAPRNPSEPRHDLSQAPENVRFYDRNHELATLKQWILTENCRIVTLTGLSGIGKTALARRLVEDIKDHFDRILWRSHRKFPTLNALQTHIIEFIAPPPPTQNPSIINHLNSRTSILNHLQNHRCLIILDDLQETLNPGECVGNYRQEYQNYGRLIDEIGRFYHQSCLLLLSWEQPLEIATLEAEDCHCKTLQLSGLGESASQLLTARQLRDKNQWSRLIELYNSNPLWLNIIATAILDLFNGSVRQFLSYPTLFLGDLEPILKQHYQRLSESEQILIRWLANQEQPVEIGKNPPELLSDSDFLKAIQSLKKRNFLEKSSGLTLQPAIAQYVKNLMS